MRILVSIIIKAITCTQGFVWRLGPDITFSCLLCHMHYNVRYFDVIYQSPCLNMSYFKRIKVNCETVSLVSEFQTFSGRGGGCACPSMPSALQNHLTATTMFASGTFRNKNRTLQNNFSKHFSNQRIFTLTQMLSLKYCELKPTPGQDPEIKSRQLSYLQILYFWKRIVSNNVSCCKII